MNPQAQNPEAYISSPGNLNSWMLRRVITPEYFRFPGFLSQGPWGPSVSRKEIWE